MKSSWSGSTATMKQLLDFCRTCFAFYFILLIAIFTLTACASYEEPDKGVSIPTPVDTVEALPTAMPKPTDISVPSDTPVPEEVERSPSSNGERNEARGESPSSSNSGSGQASTDTTADSESQVTASDESDSVETAVYFRQPSTNAVVPVTTTIILGAEGLAVEPAGPVKEESGHMHLLIDTDFVSPGEVIPSNEQHRHFGDGSTEIEVSLPAGSHILRLQFADGAHTALEGDSFRDEIVVNVRDGAPDQAVGFAQPLDGATVPPTFGVVMYATGLIPEPAGDISAGAGHFHILVDTDFIPAGEVIPKDEQHLHFGDGQLETELTLPPGDHILRLQFADGAHVALEGNRYRDEIRLTVSADAPKQQVTIVEPEDGANVVNPFTVKMSATGLFVDSAGALRREDGGHMHLLIDSEFVEPGQVVPKDDQHLHFGNGQLSTSLELEPGEHTIRLQMADGAHVAFDGSQYRDQINVVVAGTVSEEDTGAEAGQSGGEGSGSDGSVSDETSDEKSGNEPDEGSAPGVSDGEPATLRPPQELWVTMTCNVCHKIDEDQTEDNIGQPGPHQGNLYERAGDRVEGMSAEEYVYNSIINPNDHVVEGYFPNVMLQDYAEKMTEEEIRGLVSWMLNPEREPPDLP